MTQIITLKIRFEYLRHILEEQSGVKMTYPEFLECLFTKLEEEIRGNTSGLEKYYKKGEGRTLPISNQTSGFEYDYDK